MTSIAGGSDELTWTQRPIGAGPSIGDVTLRPVGTLAPPPAGRTQFGASNDPAALFAQFDAHGSFDQSSGPGAGAVAAHGAVSGTIAVPAGASETVSIVFAWYFPDRNYKVRLLFPPKHFAVACVWLVLSLFLSNPCPRTVCFSAGVAAFCGALGLCLFVQEIDGLCGLGFRRTRIQVSTV